MIVRMFAFGMVLERHAHMAYFNASLLAAFDGERHKENRAENWERAHTKTQKFKSPERERERERNTNKPNAYSAHTKRWHTHRIFTLDYVCYGVRLIMSSYDMCLCMCVYLCAHSLHHILLLSFSIRCSLLYLHLNDETLNRNS